MCKRKKKRPWLPCTFVYGGGGGGGGWSGGMSSKKPFSCSILSVVSTPLPILQFSSFKMLQMHDFPEIHVDTCTYTCSTHLKLQCMYNDDDDR